MLANLSAHNTICEVDHKCQLNELLSTKQVIKIKAETLSTRIANFNKEKQILTEHAETIFNEKAAKLQQMSETSEKRIQLATILFDQKVKQATIMFD